MARKKISTTIYLTEDQFVQLKKLSEKTRVPFAVYVREGIDLVIVKYLGAEKVLPLVITEEKTSDAPVEDPGKE